MANNYLKGKYEVKNPEKYKGDIGNVVYRSSYELAVFEFCDRSPGVLEWSSENVVVPYFDPIKNKKRRYMIDIWMKFKSRDGNVYTEIVEIKPHAQTLAPVKGRKRRETFERELATYITNTAKWEAAQKFAVDRGWNFRVITENSIFK